MGKIINTISQNVYEIRYKANPLVLDNRGQLVNYAAKIFRLEEWSIGENISVIENKKEGFKIFISHENMGISAYNNITAEEFGNHVENLNNLNVALGFLSDNIITRIGIRNRKCISYDHSFEKLIKVCQERYISIPQEIIDMIGMNLSDFAYPLNYNLNDININTNCGPMKGDQAFANFMEYYVRESVPNIGLYVDVDSYQIQNLNNSTDDLNTISKKLLSCSFEKVKDIERKILGK